jgi:hypothetical protein
MEDSIGAGCEFERFPPKLELLLGAGAALLGADGAGLLGALRLPPKLLPEDRLELDDPLDRLELPELRDPPKLPPLASTFPLNDSVSIATKIKDMNFIFSPYDNFMFDFTIR